MAAILISAVLLGVGVMTLTKPKAKKSEQRSTGKVKVRIRHAGIPTSMIQEEYPNPEVIETSPEDMYLDSMEEDPLEMLSDESLSPEKRNQILQDMKINGYKLKKKAAQPSKAAAPVIEDKVFENLDDHPCDELLEAPLNEFRDADYQ